MEAAIYQAEAEAETQVEVAAKTPVEALVETLVGMPVGNAVHLLVEEDLIVLAVNVKVINSKTPFGL